MEPGYDGHPRRRPSYSTSSLSSNDASCRRRWRRDDSVDPRPTDAANTNDGIWIYYYPGFPIVRITDRGITGWHNEQVKGARALAVSYPDVAFPGGYDTDADLLSVGTLHDDGVEIHQQFRVVVPDGTSIERVTMIGRGPTLHTLIGDAWYQLSIADMRQPPR